MEFAEPTREESILNAYSDCFKSDWGCRPSLSNITAEEAEAWLDDRQARISTNIAEGRPTFYGIGYDDAEDLAYDDRFTTTADREYFDRQDMNDFFADEEAHYSAAEAEQAELDSLFPNHHYVPDHLAQGWF